MPLKDLLVHLDNSRQSLERLDAAIALATAHEAHLIGLYPRTFPYIPGFVRAQISEDVLKAQEVMAAAAVEAAEATFNERTARAGISAEWRCVEGRPLEVLSVHARYCDVAIVGQRDPEGEEGTADPDMPDHLILSLGRPVLIIPKVGSYPVIGERVMVAWDASRLASRAVNDALPILERAKRVVVMAVNPKSEELGEIPSADICLHLARHGVNAEAQHVYADDVDVGDMLLSRAADQAIDLLVMGAYGHARWREVVLGGVTRYMLEYMTMPVLMSR